MRKTKLHVWITMMFCVVAVAAQAVQAGALHLPF
jgi:hypothetical protein